MAATLQAPITHATGLVEHLLDLLHVHGFAAVTRAHHGEVLAREAEPLRAASLHERQCLQCLERRAGVGQPVGIAGACQQPAPDIGHGDGAEMHALGGTAAAGFDQGNEGSHGLIVAGRART
jgi:hypothetical protein